MTEPSNSHADDRRSRQRSMVLGSTLVVVAVVVPLLVAQHFGALRIPRSDDWSYYRTLFEWDRTGHWDFNYWVSMTLVGQVLLAKPIVMVFGANILAVRVLTLTLGVVGLLAVARLARHCGLTATTGMAIAIVIAAGPLWGPLAATYMTDVPAFAFQMLALAAAARALTTSEGQSKRAFVASVAFALIAVSIRQYAAVTLIAVLATFGYRAWVTKDRSRRNAVAAATATAIAFVVILLSWWSTVPNPRSLTPSVPNSGSVQLAYESAGGFLRLAGLFLLPIVVWSNPVNVVRTVWHRHPAEAKFFTFLAALLLVSSYAMDPDVPFVGNYFDRRGVLADDIIAGTRPPIMPRALFELLVVIGTLSAYVIVMLAIPLVASLRLRARTRNWYTTHWTTVLLVMSVLGFATAYELAIVADLPIFDRYALPMLAPVAVLIALQQRALLEDRSRAATSRPASYTWRSGFALCLVMFLGVLYSVESASYDGVRWRVANQAVAAGYAVEDVHGGYEWVGYRLHRSPRLAPTVKQQQQLRKAYFKGLCVTVVINPPGRPKEVVATGSVVGWLRPPTPVYAIRNKLACAVAPVTR